ncbi:hypothetical protein LCGC14_2849600, partial [marine sediment metagenome]
MSEVTVAGEVVTKPRRKNTIGIDHLSLRPMHAELERFVTWYAAKIIRNNFELPVVITIQTRARKETKLGHFLAAYDKEKGDKERSAWSSKEGGMAHEINIVPEAFARPVLEILTTVAH